jgi:chromosome segregation ATPase
MMRTVKFSVILAMFACILLVNGCGSESQELQLQDDTQQERIDELEAELAANTSLLEQSKKQLADAKDKAAQDLRTQLEQSKKQLTAAKQIVSIQAETLQQKITALEEDLAKKEDLIASLQQSAGEATPPKALSLDAEVDKLSYAIAAQIAENFKKQDIEVNIETLIQKGRRFS